MMLQRLIIARLEGSDANLEFDAFSGAQHMEESIELFMSRGQTEYTKLVPDLAGVDPDDAFSSVPYEKGFYLLYYLRTLVGAGPFAAFFHDYIQTHKYAAITSAQFTDYFVAYFAEGRHALPRVSHRGLPVHGGDVSGGFDPADIAPLAAGAKAPSLVAPSVPASAVAAAKAAAIDVSGVDWDAWYYGVGAPPVANKYDDSQRKLVSAHADAWLADAGKAAADGAAITAGWKTLQWLAFLERLVETSTKLRGEAPPAVIDPAVLSAIDAAYGLGTSNNAEIRCMWNQVALRSGVEARVADTIAFLKSQGRMKVRADSSPIAASRLACLRTPSSPAVCAPALPGAAAYALRPRRCRGALWQLRPRVLPSHLRQGRGRRH